MPRKATVLALCALLLASCGSGNRRRRPGTQVPQANYQGSWAGTLTKMDSECDLATGQTTALAIAYVQNGNQVLTQGGQSKGSVNGRKLTYTTTDTSGTKKIVTKVDVDMATDGQTFFGPVEITTTDSSVNPAAVCKEDFTLYGQRVNPGATVAFGDYFPLHDGDSYEFSDGSSIKVVRDTAGNPPKVTVTYANPGGAPATTWVMQVGTAPGFLDVLGLTHFDGASLATEQYVDPNALPTLVPLPLVTLIPQSVTAGAPTITEGGRLEGMTASGERYGGRSDFYVNYFRVPQVATAIGTFTDILAMAVTEIWDKKTTEPGPGREDGDTLFNIWFARGFGPVGVQLPGQMPKPLQRATIAGVKEGS